MKYTVEIPITMFIEVEADSPEQAYQNAVTPDWHDLIRQGTCVLDGEQVEWEQIVVEDDNSDRFDVREGGFDEDEYIVTPCY